MKNCLHAIALSHRLVEGSKRLTKPRLAVLQGLPLARYTARRRDESLELLHWLDEHIRPP